MALLQLNGYHTGSGAHLITKDGSIIQLKKNATIRDKAVTVETIPQRTDINKDDVVQIFNE